MFLPGRDADKERAARKAVFAAIEEWCGTLLSDPKVRAACTVSVQEVQCGDPNCAPIDTLVTLTFDA
jgi:hypothetical protein